MKTIKLVLFVLLTTYATAQSGCTTISDGTYGNSQISPIAPLYGLYDYGWSSNIYYAADIGTAKTIASINWYVDAFQGGYSQTGPYTFSNIKVYFAYTTLSGWANTSNVSGINRLTGVNVAQGITSWTKVYDGSITFNASDAWKSILLTTPFSYNGTSNLVVHVENWDGSWAGGYPIFHYTNTTSTGNRTMKYGDNDGSMGPTSGTRTYARSDIKFCTATSLPIELVYFEGRNTVDGNLLEWQTVSETDNDYFTVERGVYANGSVDWQVIEYQPGAGNSTITNTYGYYDWEYADDINYYRLTQTDYNGQRETFKIIAINNKIHTAKIIRVTNLIGQEVPLDNPGHIIVTYDDGTIQKKFN